MHCYCYKLGLKIISTDTCSTPIKPFLIVFAVVVDSSVPWSGVCYFVRRRSWSWRSTGCSYC